MHCTHWIVKNGIKVEVNDPNRPDFGAKGITVGDQTHNGPRQVIVEFEDGNTLGLDNEQLSFVDRAEQMLNFMGDKMLQAYRNGTPCTWSEDMEPCDAPWMPYYCDDCDSWHKSCYYHNYEIEDGIFWVHIMDCDQDGNHEISYSIELLSDEYEQVEKDYFDYEEYDKAWDEYLKWVIVTGKDPLEELIISPQEFIEPIDFEITVVFNENFVELTKVRNLLNDMTWEDSELSDMPTDVKQFLFIEQIDGKWLIADGNLTPDEIRKSNMITWISDTVGKVTIGIRHTEEVTEEIIRQKAKTAIEKQKAFDHHIEELNKK